MLAVRGIYTGTEIKLLEDVRVRPNVQVIITFLEDEPLSKKIDEDTQELLALSGTREDKRLVEDIIQDTSENRTGLFGIWKDYDAVKDVDSYVRNLRKGRRIYAD